jgi:hypothetical protein
VSAPQHTGHQAWDGSAAAYVLRALDSTELDQFEDHLTGCPICREEVAGLQVVADALPSAAPAIAPPGELKHRIMTTVRADAELLRAAGSEADQPGASSTSPRRPRWRGWRGLTLRPATALAALAVMGAGVAIGAVAFGTGTGTGTGGPQPATRAAIVNQRLAPGATASIQSTPHVTTLQVAGLRPPAPGRIWQVWLGRPGQPPQPNVRFDLTTGAVAVAGDLRGVNQVMVTEEPIGFVPSAPSGPPVLRANLA